MKPPASDQSDQTTGEQVFAGLGGQGDTGYRNESIGKFYE